MSSSKAQIGAQIRAQGRGPRAQMGAETRAQLVGVSGIVMADVGSVLGGFASLRTSPLRRSLVTCLTGPWALGPGPSILPQGGR